MKASRKENSRYPGSWSDWIPDETGEYYYIQRETSEGKYQIIWNYEEDYKNIMKAPPPTEEAEPETENYTYDATQARIDAITNGVADNSIEDYNPSFPDPATITGRVKTKDPKRKTEKFDKSYKVYGQWEFKNGQVFKVLWSEPKGSGNAGGTILSHREEKNGNVHEKVRRFVVIDKRKGHCLCLPIMTYGGKGIAKRGIHKEDHAIIYSEDPPTLVDKEKLKDFQRKPLKVLVSSPVHKLDPASRLNYAKVYTVEYNVKVWFIGEIHPDSGWHLTADYNEVHPPLSFGKTTPPAEVNRRDSYATSSALSTLGASLQTYSVPYSQKNTNLHPSYGSQAGDNAYKPEVPRNPPADPHPANVLGENEYGGQPYQYDQNTNQPRYRDSTHGDQRYDEEEEEDIYNK